MLGQLVVLSANFMTYRKKLIEVSMPLEAINQESAAVSYADLSDYFYTWMRHSLKDIYPKLFTTLTTPKQQELVAEPFRHGSRENAKQFFDSDLAPKKVDGERKI